MQKTIKTDAKSLAKYAAIVAKNNAAFKKLSLPEQRVAVAEDVILQLRSKKIVAKRGNAYLDLPNVVESQIREIYGPDDEKNELVEEFEPGGRFEKFRNLLKEGALEQNATPDAPDLSAVTLQTQCTVCGIGSMFVCLAEKVDNIACTIGGYYGDVVDHDVRERETQMRYMRKWFSTDQLILIESYFENRGYASGPIVDQGNDKKRLIMIMENIISNKGKFDPNKGAHKNGKE